MSQVSKSDTLIEKYLTNKQSIDTINGLLIAQQICSRNMLQAFDMNQQESVLIIMKDIAETIENIKEKSDSG